MACVDDIRSGTGSPRATWSDERGDRYRRGEDGLDDGSHRLVESARRIDFENGELSAFVSGAGKRANDKVGAPRCNRTIQRNDHDDRARSRSGVEPEPEEECD